MRHSRMCSQASCVQVGEFMLRKLLEQCPPHTKLSGSRGPSSDTCKNHGSLSGPDSRSHRSPSSEEPCQGPPTFLTGLFFLLFFFFNKFSFFFILLILPLAVPGFRSGGSPGGGGRVDRVQGWGCASLQCGSTFPTWLVCLELAPDFSQ